MSTSADWRQGPGDNETPASRNNVRGSAMLRTPLSVERVILAAAARAASAGAMQRQQGCRARPWLAPDALDDDNGLHDGTGSGRRPARGGNGSGCGLSAAHRRHAVLVGQYRDRARARRHGAAAGPKPDAL